MDKKNIPCHIVADLLPSHMDGILSPDVEEAVVEHLANCSSCRKCLQKMEQQLAEGKELSMKRDAAFIRGIRKYKHYVIGIAIGASIPLIPFIIFVIWVVVITVTGA